MYAQNKITGVQEKAKPVTGHLQSIMICLLGKKKEVVLRVTEMRTIQLNT